MEEKRRKAPSWRGLAYRPASEMCGPVPSPYTSPVPAPAVSPPAPVATYTRRSTRVPYRAESEFCAGPAPAPSSFPPVEGFANWTPPPGRPIDLALFTSFLEDHHL